SKERHDVEPGHGFADLSVDLVAVDPPGLYLVGREVRRHLPHADGETVAVGDPATDTAGGVVRLGAVKEEHDRIVGVDDLPADLKSVHLGGDHVLAHVRHALVDGRPDVGAVKPRLFRRGDL